MVPVCALSLFQPRASLRCFDAASPVIAALLPLALLPLRLVVCVDPALPRSVAPICTRRSTCEGADTRATGRGVDSRERRAAVLCRPAAARPASGARACQQAVGAGQGAARIPGRRAGAPGLRRGSRLRAFRARGVAERRDGQRAHRPKGFSAASSSSRAKAWRSRLLYSRTKARCCLLTRARFAWHW